MTLIALTNVNRASAALNLPLGVQTGFVGRLAAPEQELHTVFKFAVTDDGVAIQKPDRMSVPDFALSFLQNTINDSCEFDTAEPVVV